MSFGEIKIAKSVYLLKNENCNGARKTKPMEIDRHNKHY